MPVLIGFYHAISRMNSTPEINLGSFLIFPLAEPSIILAVIAGFDAICGVAYRTCNGQSANEGDDVFHAVMIIGFGIILPSALTLYWVIGNIISLIQNMFIYRPWGKERSAATC
nr:YidC/Oxa1 family membrane protein insertase [Planococcus salinarum]